MTDRYHRAARDGYLEVLKEATKKDCNSRDEDGMTPTLWAAFEGNLDALRLLVGRGGDPDKCDHYGNTALHLAAAKGHLDCVKFLVNFGVNLYSLDIDHHTPQELAAMNDCTDILRYLDGVLSKEEVENPKQVKKLKEKAEKDSAKLLKDFGKHLEKAEKLAKEEKKELEKEIRTMTISEERENPEIRLTLFSFLTFVSRRRNFARTTIAQMTIDRMAIDRMTIFRHLLVLL